MCCDGQSSLFSTRCRPNLVRNFLVHIRALPDADTPGKRPLGFNPRLVISGHVANECDLAHTSRTADAFPSPQPSPTDPGTHYPARLCPVSFRDGPDRCLDRGI